MNVLKTSFCCCILVAGYTVVQAQNIFKPKVAPPRFVNDTAAIERKLLVDNMNTFSFNVLHAKLAEDKNQIVSGVSLYRLLAMLYAGAVGETRYEMRNGIGFYADQAKNDANIKTVVPESLADSTIHLETGIGLWAVETANFKKSYYNTLKEVYGLTPVFFNPADSSMRSLTQMQINEWVAQQTKGNISELIQPKDITPLTQLIAVTAFYFKGGWAKPFDEMFSLTDKFYPSASKEVEVDYMNQSSEFNYFETELMQVVEMDYANPNYALSIILPHEGETLNSIEKEVTASNMAKIWNDMILARVQLTIPKFAINTGGLLNSQLQSLGMKQAFTDKAQFADITEQNNLKLDKFIQQCRFVVDEKGSEASAAAAVTMSTKSAFIANQILAFRADRPFYFVLREKKNNLLLMVGKVLNPQQ